MNARGDPHAAVFGKVVHDRVVHEIRAELQQERVGADGGGRVARRLDDEVTSFREREKRLRGFLRDEGQVTIQNHLKAIFAKTRVRSRQELVSHLAGRIPNTAPTSI
jgi:hypothetical protein